VSQEREKEREREKEERGKVLDGGSSVTGEVVYFIQWDSEGGRQARRMIGRGGFRGRIGKACFSRSEG
jgi:hypothetical protein